MADQVAPSPEYCPVDSTLGLRLSRLVRSLRSSWAKTLASLSLSPPEAAILRAIGEEPGIGIRALARYTHSDPMNVKRAVDALQSRSMLLSTNSVIDSRSYALLLTDNGALLCKQVNELATAQATKIMTTIPHHAQQDFLDALGSLENLFVFSDQAR